MLLSDQRMFSLYGKHALRFGKIEFGDLEKTWSAFWRNHDRRFGEIVFGVLEKSCSAFGRNRVRHFGENVVGVFGDRYGVS